jgi:histidinol-phosphate aminotransferase
MNSRRGVSRRDFARNVVLAAAAAPVLGIDTGDAAVSPAGAGPVRLHFNENPYGPSPLARRALTSLSDAVWQYPGEAREDLLSAVASLHRVPSEDVLLGNGSAELLQAAALAFLSAAKPLVVADPTYEALEQYAATAGVRTIRTPLAENWGHDVRAMLEAHSAPGILYLCNPNNPTAGITPRADVRQLIRDASAETIVLVDEAYAHYVDSPEYESVIPLVGSHPNLVVIRTFSKIYGLAGLRMGYAVAQPQTLKRLRARQSRNSLNAAALLAARASLRDTGWVEESRARNRKVRDAVLRRINEAGFAHLPTEANFFMIDLGRDIRPVQEAMRGRGVMVGRPFPPLLNHLRVTVGTEEQMARFVAAFEQSLR